MARTLLPLSPFARPLPEDLLPRAPKDPRAKERSSLFRELLALALVATVFAGCPKPAKPPSTPGDLPTTTRDFVQHHYSLSWSDTDFTTLKKLTLDFAFSRSFPGEVELVPTPGESLSITLEYHVQNENHAIRARQYINALTAVSRPLGDEPRFVIPEAVQLPAELRCAREMIPGRALRGGKTEPAVERVLGVCPVKVTLQIPAALPKAFEIRNAKRFKAHDVSLERLDLVLSPGSVSTIRSIRGDLRLSGGDAQTSVSVDGLAGRSERDLFGEAKGSLSANLDSIRDLILTRIEGPIGIALDHPEGANVRINGEIIRDFPYPHQ